MIRRSGRSPRGAAASGVRSVNYATSPLLASKTPPWRSRFVVAMLGLAFLGLVARAAWVQIVGTDFYRKEGEKRFAHTMQVAASRGRVLDRNGQVLATSVPALSIWAVAKDFQAEPDKRKVMLELLGMTAAELEERLDSGAKVVRLRRQVDDPVWQRLGKLGIKGLYEEREFKRKYPEGEAAVHVVGYTDIAEVGREGIELRFDEQLRGRHGERTVVRDRLGKVVEDLGDQIDPVNGQDIQLSIDSKIQFFAHQKLRDAVAAHGATGGSVVVLDVQTGEVLALANAPSYNPAGPRNPQGPGLRNRALTDVAEPGSTIKPFAIALALEKKLVTPQTVIQTAPGHVTIGAHMVKDVHPRGALTVAEVVQKSSNVGTVKIALQLPPREMWELYSQLGFGRRPQVDFPGAAGGRLRPYKTWRTIGQATMSYGYGLSVSLLQLARAYTVFARDGELVPVTMLRQGAPVAGEAVLAKETAREMRRMLQMAAGPGGTAPLAEALGYSVAGKSGTARTLLEGRGYGNKHRAWFVGMAPASAPRIVVAVMVDEPSRGAYYGGDVAAPVFSQVVAQTLRMLGVPPDREVKAQILAKPVPAEPESF